MHPVIGKFALATLSFCLFATPALADKLQVGDKVGALTLPDQFGNEHTVKEMPATVILTFEKKTGALVNGFLKKQEKDFLAKNNALYIADIARMPMIITKTFALPKMKKYPHTILLAYDDDFQAPYPMKKKNVTILHFDDEGKITAIVFVDNETRLQDEISK